MKENSRFANVKVLKIVEKNTEYTIKLIKQ